MKKLQILTSFSLLPNRFGVFGGSFDPVQNAHVAIVRHAHDRYGLDAIVCIPNGRNPLKENYSEVSDEHRIRMLEIAFTNDSYVYLSKIEIEREPRGPSFTIDTLREVRAECGDRKIVFIGGSDILSSLAKWREPKEIFDILDECIILERSSDDEKKLLGISESISPGAYDLLKAGYDKSSKFMESATEVRTRLKNGQDISGMVPPLVLDYIKANSLYLG